MINYRRITIPKKLNLQFHAEPLEGQADPQEPIEGQAEQTETTFTKSDFDREISKMYEKFESKFSKKAEEAQKLASMNAEEKARYEIEQSKKEIEEMRKNFTLTQNKTECMKILAERNIDVSLADFVVAEDAETMKKNIDLIDKAFKKSVEQEVNFRLKSTTPKRDLNMPTEITKETFSKMSLDQMQELASTNKELFNQLTK